MKKTAALFLVCALLLCYMPSAFALVSQSESFYVADYANVLSQSTEDWLISTNAQLEQQCNGAQIVVVTVDYLGGMYADEYAYELFNDWGVGSAEENNGMLLLLAVQEGKAWLAYGLGLQMEAIEGYRQVNIAEQAMEDCFWDDFDAGNYDAAVNKLVNELLNCYSGRYGGSAFVPQEQYAGADGGRSKMDNGIRTIVPLLILIAVLSLLFSRPRRRRYIPRPGSGFAWGYGLGMMNARRRRTPPPPPPPSDPFRGTSFRAPAPPPSAARRPSSPPRPTAPRPGNSRAVGGIGRSGGRPGGGGGMGRGGGGFSGGGAGRR